MNNYDVLVEFKIISFMVEAVVFNKTSGSVNGVNINTGSKVL